MELIGRLPLPHHHRPSSSTSDLIRPQTSIPNFFTLRRNLAPSLPATNPQVTFSNHLLSLAIALTLNTTPLPCYAIPSFISPSPSPSPSPTTPFSQSKTLQIGLEDGRIRPCPSTNPGCVSTNPKSSSFSFPWRIPHSGEDDTVPEEFAVQSLEEAIMKTQKNPEIRVKETTPFGRYLEAEVDGFYGTRDILEFLVKGDVVTYRCVAKKVTFVYPFTTAIGDSKGQQERLNQIVNQLNWFALTFDSMT